MDGLRWHSWRLQTAIIGGEARANFDIAPRLDMTNHHVQSQRIYGRVSGTRDRTPPFAAVRTPERTPAGKGEEVRHRALHVIEIVFDPFQSTSPEAAVDDLGVTARRLRRCVAEKPQPRASAVCNSASRRHSSI